MTTTLIVNADDYGRTPEVSSGIRHAHHEGLISTTTVMVNMPDVLDQIRRAQDECPRLGLGVHLNLTVGPPCAPTEEIPSLLDSQGHFRDRAAFIQSLDGIDPTQVEIELRAQIQKFLTTGAILDHLDSHHHIVAFGPALWEIHLKLAEEYGCGVRPSFPSDIPPIALIDVYPPSVLSFACQEAMELLRSSKVPHPDHFMASFFGPGVHQDHLLALLRDLPSGVCELMCHPGYIDPVLLAESGYAKERELELSILTHPIIKQTVQQAEIRLSTYRDAWNSSPVNS